MRKQELFERLVRDAGGVVCARGDGLIDEMSGSVRWLKDETEKHGLGVVWTPYDRGTGSKVKEWTVKLNAAQESGQ